LKINKLNFFSKNFRKIKINFVNQNIDIIFARILPCVQNPRLANPLKPKINKDSNGK